MKADFHMHTGFSFDTDSIPEEMVKKAIELGLQTICITDHHDEDYPEDITSFQLDVDAYFAEMKHLQEKYKNQINMRIGVELGLQPHLGEFYKNFVAKHPFDFVIGSMHVFDKMDPYFGAYFKGRSDKEAYRAAFEETLETIKNIHDFDVLGHIDYVVRYGMKKQEEYSYDENKDIIDEILKHLISNGKGIELNTAGFKYGLGFCHPYPEIIKRYKELGGEIITIGSDGHKPEHIAYDFCKVNDILTECGFKYYTEFVERKPIFHELR